MNNVLGLQLIKPPVDQCGSKCVSTYSGCPSQFSTVQCKVPTK